MYRKVSTFAALAASAAALTLAAPSFAAFQIPDGPSGTAPFEDWSRGNPLSTYDEWDVFTVATGAPGNGPDVASINQGATGRITQNVPGAFITGGGNIYSFAVATDFDLTRNLMNLGTGADTRIVLQLRTLGSDLDLGSVLLDYDGGTQQLAATGYTEVDRITLGGFGGDQVDHLFYWDIINFNPATINISFAAASSSLSLDRVALDSYVPEPGSLALLGLGGLCLLARSRRGS